MLHNEPRRARVIAALPALVLIFCVLQPLLDVAGFWQFRLGLGNALTLGLRTVLLAGMTLLGFLLSERKRYYVLTALILAVLTGLHVLACLRAPGGYEAPLTDLINLVRIYFLPLMTLCFITFLRRNERVLSALRTGLAVDLGLIVLVMILSAVTGTDRHTYANDKIGTLGWFLWSNSQSAILSMLTPLTVLWALKKWPDRSLPAALAAAVGEGALFFLAPRLAYLCALIGGGGMALSLLIWDRRHWRQALAIGLVTALCAACFPLAPLQQRKDTVERVDEKNQEKIEQRTELAGSFRPEDLEDETLRAQILRIYNSYIPIQATVQRFGLERTAKQYGYTLDASVLGSQRLVKLNFCRLQMQDAGLMGRLFGLELNDLKEFLAQSIHDVETDRWVDGYINFDVENDFHGVYFLTGLTGLILMMAFLLGIGLWAAIRTLRRFRTRFEPQLAAFAIAYCCAMGHAAFTASVLRRNNASVYLAMVLAGLWVLSARKPEQS